MMFAESMAVHGTAWIGVAIAAVGTAGVWAGLVRASRPVAVAGLVGVALVILVEIAAMFGGSYVVVPAILCGQLATGFAAGLALPRDRRSYLTVTAGCLLAWLVGQAVLFPRGEQWSGDPLALASATGVAFLIWLPAAAGSAVGFEVSEHHDRRSV